MADLRSIDLTRNRRFEQSLNKSDADLIKSVENFQHEQLVRRLKKGEIRHASKLVDDYDSEPVTSTSALDALYDLSNWVVTFDDTNTMTTWTINTGLNNTTIPIMTGSYTTWSDNHNRTWSESFDDALFDDREQTISMRHISTDSGDICTMWNITSKYNSGIDTDGIRSRIMRDPFQSNGDDSGGLIWRMKRNNAYREFNIEKYRYPSFLDRLSDMSEDSESFEYDYLTRDLINRLDTRPRQRRFTFEDKSESELKERAPVVKRIYVTNGGRSFDSEQFRFEMVLAEEHYHEAIQKINMKGTN